MLLFFEDEIGTIVWVEGCVLVIHSPGCVSNYYATDSDIESMNEPKQHEGCLLKPGSLAEEISFNHISKQTK